MLRKLKSSIDSFYKGLLWVLFVGMILSILSLGQLIRRVKKAFAQTYNWAALFLILTNLLYFRPCLYLEACNPIITFKKLGLFNIILIELGLYLLFIIILYIFQIITYGKRHV